MIEILWYKGRILFWFLTQFENKVILLCVMDEVDKLFVSIIIKLYYECILSYIMCGNFCFLRYRSVYV